MGMVVLLALGVVVVASCGSGEGSVIDGGAATDTPGYEKALAAAPPELQELYANGDGMLPGGATTFEEQLDNLRGYPIVVNHWASWCGPCREEFPYFQSQAAEHLDEVAFVGIDSQDSEDAAVTFLAGNPLPYPSIADPDGDFASWVDTALVGIPNTLFYDREGELVYVKQGPFVDEAELAADIERYALSD